MDDEGRVLRRVLAGLAAFAVIAWLATGGAGLLWRWTTHHVRSNPTRDATPELLRDMPSDPDDIRRELAARVAAHFPEGMPDASLIGAVRQQGFNFDTNPGGQRFGYFVQKRGYCLSDCLVHWDISWRRNAKGRAVEIASGYERIGIPFTGFGDLFDTD